MTQEARRGRPTAPQPPDRQLVPLKAAGDAYTAAAAEMNRARKVRDAAIRKALKQGMTHAQIAQAAGVTRGRVNQIAQES